MIRPRMTLATVTDGTLTADVTFSYPDELVSQWSQRAPKFDAI